MRVADIFDLKLAVAILFAVLCGSGSTQLANISSNAKHGIPESRVNSIRKQKIVLQFVKLFGVSL